MDVTLGGCSLALQVIHGYVYSNGRHGSPIRLLNLRNALISRIAETTIQSDSIASH